jgi:hypothetical protein
MGRCVWILPNARRAPATALERSFHDELGALGRAGRGGARYRTARCDSPGSARTTRCPAAGSPAAPWRAAPRARSRRPSRAGGRRDRFAPARRASGRDPSPRASAARRRSRRPGRRVPVSAPTTSRAARRTRARPRSARSTVRARRRAAWASAHPIRRAAPRAHRRSSSTRCSYGLPAMAIDDGCEDAGVAGCAACSPVASCPSHYAVDSIYPPRYGVRVWDVEFTNEFAAWWDTLSSEEQQGIDAAVRVLEQRGPGLGRPLVDSVTGSRHANMKELRVGTIGSCSRSIRGAARSC